MEDDEFQRSDWDMETHWHELRHAIRSEWKPPLLLQRSTHFVCTSVLGISRFVIKPAPPAATVGCLVGSGFNNYYSRPPVKAVGKLVASQRPFLPSASCVVLLLLYLLFLVPFQAVKLPDLLFKTKSHDTSNTSMAACLIAEDSSWAADWSSTRCNFGGYHQGLHAHLFIPAVFIVNELSDQLWCFDSMCAQLKHLCDKPVHRPHVHY